MIIDEAIKFKNSPNFEKGDIIACLFDRDNNSNEILKSAKIKAEHNDILIYFSNPCFEVWILCHYENCSSFEPKEIYSHLKQRFNLDTKAEKSLYEVTKTKLSSAKARCASLSQNIKSKGIELISINSNPITEIYKLLDLIESFD